MRKAIFKNEKNGNLYAQEGDKLYTVYAPKDYEANWKQTIKGKPYFTGECELRISKAGNAYFTLIKADKE